MDFQTSEMVPDGLSKIPKLSRIKPSAFKILKLLKFGCRSYYDPDLVGVSRRFPEVLRKDMEAFQNIAKTFRNIPILRIPLSGTLRGPSGWQV